MFSCRTRGFCPSCHAKRVEEWGEWMRETLLVDVPHRQIVFTIPKRLRVFFKFDRRLLGDLCRCALRSLSRYFEVVAGSALTPGVIAAIQTFGDRINLHMHLHFLMTEGGVFFLGLTPASTSTAWSGPRRRSRPSGSRDWPGASHSPVDSNHGRVRRKWTPWLCPGPRPPWGSTCSGRYSPWSG
jgi:hypothetical protein